MFLKIDQSGKRQRSIQVILEAGYMQRKKKSSNQINFILDMTSYSDAYTVQIKRQRLLDGASIRRKA